MQEALSFVIENILPMVGTIEQCAVAMRRVKQRYCIGKQCIGA